jgi:hypothetical protein
MLKKLFSCLLIVVLGSIMLPASAIAGSPQPLHLNVRNQTGGTVQLNLTDANGDMTFIALEPGVFPVDLTEGIYSYWASTPCGNVAGSWNVNVSKTLFLSCKNDLLALSFVKTYTRNSNCADFGFLYNSGGGMTFVSQTHYGEPIGDFWAGDVSTYEEAKFDIINGYGFSVVEGCLTSFDYSTYATNIIHSH